MVVAQGCALRPRTSGAFFYAIDATPASAGGQPFDIHQDITDRIIEAMEQARGTGRRLWDSQPSLPINLTTGKPYQGINTLLTAAAQASKAHSFIKGLLADQGQEAAA